MKMRLLYGAWFCLALAMLFIASLPLGLNAQLSVTALALGAMGAIRMTRRTGVWRSIFLGLGTFVVLRYLFWRLGSTIPGLDSPGDFIAGIILAGAECYCVLMMFLSLFTVADPIERPSAPRLDDDRLPTVDVLIPSYNEMTDILAPTLAAAKRMIYPASKLRVFLLDDGGTDEKLASADPGQAAAAARRRASLQDLCRDLGVDYLARPANRQAKAGNLNHGLAHSHGDLVVVLDADHAPSREFLIETVGFFEDDKLFLVQTPHFFLNADPIERNVSADRMPAENQMFYKMTQKGLDKWNAAFFCGSAAVLRRTALDEVQGFHGSSITEDAETALELHARGWKSLYVDRPMIAGLQPETFESFIGQRSRWCRGMVQILLLKNPLFKRGLTPAQRLCYLSSTLFWLFPLPRMIFIFMPMLYIFFGMKIYIANRHEFIAYTLTYMVSVTMIQNYVFGTVRWPWTSDLYEYIQSVQLFRAVLSVFINPRCPKFEVTAKGVALDHSRLSPLARPYFAVFALVCASFAVLIYRYVSDVNSRELLVVVGAWTLLNLGLSGIALGAVSERRERRGVPRVDSRIQASLSVGTEVIPVTVTDMSFGGLRIRPSRPFAGVPRSQAILRVSALDTPDTVWETYVAVAGSRTPDREGSVGLKFTGLRADRYRIVAHVMFANMFAAYEDRSRNYRVIGILQASAMLGIWCVVQTGRGLYFGLFRRPGSGAEPTAAEAGILAERPST